MSASQIHHYRVRFADGRTIAGFTKAVAARRAARAEDPPGTVERFERGHWILLGSRAGTAIDERAHYRCDE
jgi:hypothetical protein